MLSACQFHFNINAWQAVGERLADKTQWQQWAIHPQIIHELPEYQPALTFLPAMQRRRLSKSARLVCQAAWQLADEFTGCPLVYASHDGEINRSFELWAELLSSHTVSPTSFGLSVHNAIAGQWSMLRQDMSENTALAVGCDGLENALAEAYALLCEGAPHVLVVLADAPLLDDYTVQAQRAPFAYALAMVISPGEQYRLSLLDTPHIMPSENPVPPYWGALDWIRFLLSDGITTHQQHHGKRIWQWQKNR